MRRLTDPCSQFAARQMVASFVSASCNWSELWQNGNTGGGCVESAGLSEYDAVEAEQTLLRIEIACYLMLSVDAAIRWLLFQGDERNRSRSAHFDRIWNVRQAAGAKENSLDREVRCP